MPTIEHTSREDATVAPTVAAPVWRAVTRGRAGLLAHAVRGARTLCGKDTTRLPWCDDTDPADVPRCWRCDAIPAGHATLWDLLELGLTLRRIDYWSTHHGWLRPINPGCGSGARRAWPPREYAIAAVMLRKIGEGYTPEGAHRQAREAVP